MKRIFKILFIVLVALNVHSQEILWEKTLGGAHAEFLNDAIATPDYGFIVAGSTLSKKAGKSNKKNAGDFDYYIAKLSEYGKLEHSTTFGGSGTDQLQSIYRTHDGGSILVGTSNSPISGDKTVPNLGQMDIWLVKLDINGNLEWQKALGGLGMDKAELVINTQDGGYLIGGSSASSNYKNTTYTNKDLIYKSENSRGNLDYWLVKLKQDGSLAWQKTLGGKYVDELRSVLELPEGGFIVGGVSNSPQSKDKNADSKGFNDWWILRLDKDGNEEWQTEYATEGDDQLYSIVLTQDNHILVGGNIGNLSSKGSQTNSDFFVLKLNLDGDEVWNKTFDIGTQDIMTNLVQNKDGSFLISGYVTTNGKSIGKEEGVEDYMLIKIDQNGEKKWQKSVGSKQKEVLKHSIETRDGGYVLLGTRIKKGGKNNSNFWIVKLKDLDKEETVKKLLEAMPNPARDYTTVVLGYKYEKGTVLLYDINGRLIRQNEIKGSRMIPVNMQNLSMGVYIVHVKTDVQEDSIKIIKAF